MALGAVLAAALTDHSARTRGLYINGLDVIRPAGGSYGVIMDSLHVTEAGPGNVSRLTATIDDPQGVLTFDEKAVVRFEDLTRGTPIFLGFLLVAEPKRLGLARTIEIEAVGIEVLLDWLIMKDTVSLDATGPSDATTWATSIQRLYAACVPIGYPLRVMAGPTIISNSTQALPTANLNWTFSQTTITGPMTLRAALEYMVVAAGRGPTDVIGFTVDFWGGLRTLWRLVPTQVLRVDDWSDTTTVTTAGPVFPVNTAHVTDSASTTHQVYVAGGNAAGSGVVTDGSGIIGPVTVITNSAILDAATRDLYGQRWLSTHGSAVRGSVGTDGTLNIGAPGSEIHAGAEVTVTDATMGLSAYSAVIQQIDKEFRATDETWMITYGNPAASGAKLIRQLTRTTVN